MSSLPPNTALYIRNLNDKVKKEGSSNPLLYRQVLLKRGRTPARAPEATLWSLYSVWQGHLGSRPEGSEDEGAGICRVPRSRKRNDCDAKS